MDFGKGLERVKMLRAHLAEGSGKPGEVLDETPRVACGEGALRWSKCRGPGAAPVSGAEFLRGAHLEPGALLTAPVHAPL